MTKCRPADTKIFLECFENILKNGFKIIYKIFFCPILKSF